jgi:hypothetical protein
MGMQWKYMAAAHGIIVPVKGKVLPNVSSYVQKRVLSCGALMLLSVTQFIKLPLFILILPPPPWRYSP